MTIRNPIIRQMDIWNSAVNHPLQSWAWGQFRQKMGITVEKIVAGNQDKPDGCWQMTFHKIPGTPYTVGYFPKGPAVTEFMLSKLKEVARKHHAIFIQIEPNIINPENNPDYSFQRPESDLVASHRPLFTKYTFILDLTKSEEELLKAMHPKTRYNLKIAAKHNVIVKEDSSPEAFNEYLRLEAETTSRQKFYAHAQMYHRSMWDIMHQAGIAKLWTARAGNEVLAAWILFLWKDTIYYPYGASSRNKRETMAPNLLLWEIAKWGKANGFKKFDLWGAIGPDPDPNDPWYGFHRFKAGYNPQMIEFIGSFDLVINPFLYKLYCLADTVRWSILKILKH
jgi:lipid II:glycine glycyltransferase (peptidoglycan interpeptide bridge formation enzyme)